MTFNDDDLRQLKKSENAIQRSLGIPALLARLEAAESLIMDLVYEDDGMYFPKYHEGADVSKFEEFKAWRRTAGKE